MFSQVRKLHIHYSSRTFVQQVTYDHIAYFDSDTEYPSQRQKHDLLSLIRSIPGAEWYTEDKLSSWFVNRRAYQRKREEEEEEGGDPFVRPGQRGPGRPKGSRNKESVVHVMSSSNIRT